MTNPSFLRENKSNQFCFFNPFLLISNHGKKRPQKFASGSISSSNLSVFSPSQWGLVMPDFNAKDAFSSEKIDFWMQKSVPDIVKHLEEAPLLAQIYSENGGDIESGRTKCKIEKARLEKWPIVKSEWENGELKSPNGLIFVKELEQKNNLVHNIEERVTKAWGVIVQQKGMACEWACYLLQTSRVCGGTGLGFCTHFCLMKVKNFRDSALE